MGNDHHDQVNEPPSHHSYYCLCGENTHDLLSWLLSSIQYRIITYCPHAVPGNPSRIRLVTESSVFLITHLDHPCKGPTAPPLHFNHFESEGEVGLLALRSSFQCKWGHPVCSLPSPPAPSDPDMVSPASRSCSCSEG